MSIIDQFPTPQSEDETLQFPDNIMNCDQFGVTYSMVYESVKDLLYKGEITGYAVNAEQLMRDYEDFRHISGVSLEGLALNRGWDLENPEHKAVLHAARDYFYKFK